MNRAGRNPLNNISGTMASAISLTTLSVTDSSTTPLSVGNVSVMPTARGLTSRTVHKIQTNANVPSESLRMSAVRSPERADMRPWCSYPAPSTTPQRLALLAVKHKAVMLRRRARPCRRSGSGNASGRSAARCWRARCRKFIRVRRASPDRRRSACSTPDSEAAADDASGRRMSSASRHRRSRAAASSGRACGRARARSTMSLPSACSSPIRSAWPESNDRQHAVGDEVAGANQRRRPGVAPIVPFASARSGSARSERSAPSGRSPAACSSRRDRRADACRAPRRCPPA